MYILSKVLSHDFVVVEVVFDALDDLIVFVSFAGDEDDVTFLGEDAGGLDGGLAVLDDKGGAQLILRKPGSHIAQDIRGFLIARVVAGQYQLVGVALGYLRHHGAFALVAIAAAADDGDKFRLPVWYRYYSFEDNSLGEEQ